MNWKPSAKHQFCPLLERFASSGKTVCIIFLIFDVEGDSTMEPLSRRKRRDLRSVLTEPEAAGGAAAAARADQVAPLVHALPPAPPPLDVDMDIQIDLEDGQPDNNNNDAGPQPDLPQAAQPPAPVNQQDEIEDGLVAEIEGYEAELNLPDVNQDAREVWLAKWDQLSRRNMPSGQVSCAESLLMLFAKVSSTSAPDSAIDAELKKQHLELGNQLPDLFPTNAKAFWKVRLLSLDASFGISHRLSPV